MLINDNLESPMKALLMIIFFLSIHSIHGQAHIEDIKGLPHDLANLNKIPAASYFANNKIYISKRFTKDIIFDNYEVAIKIKAESSGEYYLKILNEPEELKPFACYFKKGQYSKNIKSNTLQLNEGESDNYNLSISNNSLFNLNRISSNSLKLGVFENGFWYDSKVSEAHLSLVIDSSEPSVNYLNCEFLIEEGKTLVSWEIEESKKTDSGLDKLKLIKFTGTGDEKSEILIPLQSGNWGKDSFLIDSDHETHRFELTVFDKVGNKSSLTTPYYNLDNTLPVIKGGAATQQLFSNKIIIKWDDNSRATSYRVHRSRNPYYLEYINVRKDKVISDWISFSHYEDFDVDSNTKYYYFIESRSNTGEKSFISKAIPGSTKAILDQRLYGTWIFFQNIKRDATLAAMLDQHEIKTNANIGRAYGLKIDNKTIQTLIIPNLVYNDIASNEKSPYEIKIDGEFIQIVTSSGLDQKRGINYAFSNSEDTLFLEEPLGMALSYGSKSTGDVMRMNEKPTYPLIRWNLPIDLDLNPSIENESLRIQGIWVSDLNLLGRYLVEFNYPNVRILWFDKEGNLKEEAEGRYELKGSILSVDYPWHHLMTGDTQEEVTFYDESTFVTYTETNSKIKFKNTFRRLILSN